MKIEDIDIENDIGHVGEVLTEGQKARGLLIHALQEIQKAYNYLPEDVLSISKKLDIPLSEIYSTAYVLQTLLLHAARPQRRLRLHGHGLPCQGGREDTRRPSKESSG